MVQNNFGVGAHAHSDWGNDGDWSIPKIPSFELCFWLLAKQLVTEASADLLQTRLGLRACQ